ncbi:hypothetical protein [Streptomyces anthocyanicus]|uniref:hypothetical protein n=1 Tax=Streptomyces anthocyanicus TaxID=68174 RepID=UPI00216B531D|nr:hypothetical protein [Streptomyces anthocyanicus]
MILASHGFHIRRALACARRRADSYGVSAADHYDAVWCYGATRELFYASKAVLDVVVEPDPQLLGLKEAGAESALADAP